MKLKTLITGTTIVTAVFILAACGGGGVKKDREEVDLKELTKGQPEIHGKLLTEKDVTITHPLDQTMVATGKSIYELKCQSCHRLTADRLVGPGWKDVTKRRTPVWIMNMITNVDIMLETDEEAQKQLELCLVRMPNQNVSVEEARSILEFMRYNDGEQ
jgi:hypothetical protein